MVLRWKSSGVALTANLVCPGPFFKVGAGRHVVEASVPQDGTWRLLVMEMHKHVFQRTRRDGAHERVDDGRLSQHVDGNRKFDKCGEKSVQFKTRR